MSLSLIDSYDHYDTASMARKITTVGGTTTEIVASEGRCDTQALHLQGAGLVDYGVAAPGTTGVIGVAVRPITAGATGEAAATILVFDGTRGSLTNRLYFYIGSSGAISVHRDAGILPNVLLGSTPGGVVSFGVWNYVECKFKLETTATGTIEIRVNGVTQLSLSGIVTSIGNANGHDGTADFDWNGVGLSANGGEFYFDDLYVLNGASLTSNPLTDFLGDIHVGAVLPESDGTHTDWGLSAGGDHFALVDESPVPDDDTTYIVSSTPGDQDTFNYPAIKLTAGTVLAVQTSILARKDDAGNRVMRALVRSGGTTAEGGDIGVTDSGYVYGRTTFEENPVGSVVWTISSVNAAEFGVKLES